jgi:hypothetical protein
MDPEAAKWPPRSMMCWTKTPNAGGYRRQYPSTPVTLHEQVFDGGSMPRVEVVSLGALAGWPPG